MKYIFGFLFLTQLCIAQSPYPQDYFRKPLDIDIILSGTFAELRSNHFHSGIDIKTQQRTGLKVYAAAEGYVSRIKVSHFGYGKALYITHPNGYVSVYAHLKKFSPRIEQFIKACQYEKESYEVEVFPSPTELPITSDEIVAYSGNTGSSGGPHLHFEIRDNEERPINPMLFGIQVKDSKTPMLTGVYAYPKNRTSHVNNSRERQELRLIPKKDGDYATEAITATGDIGVGIVSYDQQDLARNKNGVSNIQAFYNGNKTFEMDFKRFSFDESKHINRYIDFEVYKEKKSRIQKLFVESGNTLSMLKDVSDDGYLKIEDSTDNIYRVRIRDFEGNESWLNIPIAGQPIKEKLEAPDLKPSTYIIADQVNEFTDGNISVYIPKNTFYEDFYMDYNVANDTLTLHRDVVPLQKNASIKFDISNYSDADKQQLYIAKLYGYYKRPGYVNTKRLGDFLSTSTKSLGTFTIAQDSVNPTISPVNFQEGKWMSKQQVLKVNIEDEDSGISNYRATLNGKWILMEYEYKKGTLTYDFSDNIISDTENNLKIIVTDNVGNNATFEATFYRK
ncbi:M23 family metallopeptidase [Psychroserpens sp.]|uniref:M23 family metallopeptidase n=1 Tax=Psychroserpens sp. TaxID=2020870 RepID=UPI001B1653C7|nr:M23 family metallopeptidase [Psychroserpens sp.]MBO6607303.1 M23 family metallopeptidase [Psychroserpens sp.]MBO6631490.1 M23 family metallopeptidase [Psychroserpens sp.]MBO6654621.1 M23 family metallopeptidase [Psychroserpens sp.]MBO6681032.1 M23 family metallopeptidase [Psychroserpens sp.]MBO6750013.1 M23 family metallopeptidase [Psychroserpens sp.]